MNRRLYLYLKLRFDLATFIHRTFQTVAPAQTYHSNWHIKAMAHHLQQCASGQIKRLLITLPPRHLKSICASVAFPAWVLGHDPSKRIICASYSADLASKHAHDCRAVMEADWYQRISPHTKISEKNAEMDFMTTRHGYRYSTSIGGTLTGRGGNILIIDDPLKSEDAFSEAKRSAVNEWFDGTLYSRLDNKLEDVIILIMQRLHLEDLAGHVLQQEPWVHLNLAAIAEIAEHIPIGFNETYFRKVGDVLDEQREPREVLARVKTSLGSYNFSAQYQQRPVPLEGEIIKWEWFRFYDNILNRQPGDEVVQSWDTAYKAAELSDYSVCTTWVVRGNQFYLVDILRDKLDYPNLKKKLIEHAQLHRVDVVIIENKGSGMSLIDDLRQGGAAGVPMPIAFEPEKDKVTRMAAQSARIEAGQVLLPRKAAWLDDFRTELLQFPRGRHDDQVDSVSQFLDWIHKRSTATPFSCHWMDPWPTMEETSAPAEVPAARPVAKTAVFVSVRQNGRSTLMSREEFAQQIGEKIHGEHDDDSK